MAQRWIAWTRNPNINVGSVEARDETAIVAGYVIQDDWRVQEFDVDRRTDWIEPAEQ